MSGGVGSALAEGLFWYAEKLHYGYEGVEKNFEEALSLYRQAAELGYPRAFLRIGEMHERGLGTPVDLSQALACYLKARETGDLTGLAAIARLVGRSQHRQKSEALWAKFFATLPNTTPLRWDRAAERSADHEATRSAGLEPNPITSGRTPRRRSSWRTRMG